MNKKKIKIFLVFSVLSLVMIIFITYRITNPQRELPEPDIEEYPVSSSKYLINQRNILNKLSDNFNNKQLINKYITGKALVKASVLGNTIVVNYSDDITVEQFDFVLDQDVLSINVVKDKRDLFINIFKIMIEANQIRLGNNDDLSSYFDKYINDNLINDNIIINKSDNTYEYIIKINKIIK